MTPQLWQALCQTAAMYPTCTLRLRQHEGWIRSFTVEHGPTVVAEPLAVPPAHVQPTVAPTTTSARKRV